MEMNTGMGEQVSADFLKHLRTSTNEWHEKLEALELSTSILKDDIRLADYVRYVSAMYGFVQPFEAVAFPVLAGVFPDVEGRRKAHLLEADLAVLGVDAGTLPKAVVPQGSLYELLGAMYVMEGSALGGMVIAKHLQKTLALGVSNGASFFQPYGMGIGAQWKSFLSFFTAFTLEHEAEEELTAGAVATFRGIHDWFAAYA